MAENKVQLSKSDRMSVCMRHQFLQGSWNYERMQNGGWCFAMIPAIKKLYSNKEDQIAALKRHMEFYNTHPYVSAPVIGVTLALEEDRANGAQVEDAAIQGVKVGMMGPLAGVGDPVFWFTLRPILGALGASLALGGSIMGPLLFFFAWNIIRIAFLWYTQEFGYKVGTSITKDLSGGLMGKITEGASILGMFIIGALVQRWVSISFTPVVSTVQQSPGAYIDWASLPPQRERPAPLFVKSATHRTAGTRQLRPTHSRKNVPVKPSAPGKKSMGIALSALRRVPSWIRFASVQLLCCPSRCWRQESTTVTATTGWSLRLAPPPYPAAATTCPAM